VANAGDSDSRKKENETTMHIEHPQQDTSASAKEMIVKDVRMGSKNRICRPQWSKKTTPLQCLLWCKGLRGTLEDTIEQARPAFGKPNSFDHQRRALTCEAGNSALRPSPPAPKHLLRCSQPYGRLPLKGAGASEEFCSSFL